MSKISPNEMGFFDHLEELRGRIFKSLILWVLVFIVCFLFSKQIFNILAQPFADYMKRDVLWYATNPSEPFFAHLRAAFWVSLIFSSSIFFYHVWAFVSPGLEKHEKQFAIPFLFFMAIFFMIGCWFSFSVVFPYVLNFLISWNEGGVDAYTRSRYLSLLFGFVLGLGSCFEMPLLIFFFAKIGVVTPQFLLAKFKYAVLAIAILAAIITPTPDIPTQCIVGIPLICLYLIGVGAAFLVRKKPEVEEDEKGDDLPQQKS